MLLKNEREVTSVSPLPAAPVTVWRVLARRHCRVAMMNKEQRSVSTSNTFSILEDKYGKDRRRGNKGTLPGGRVLVVKVKYMDRLFRWEYKEMVSSVFWVHVLGCGGTGWLVL